ncbi:MAG: hypothetical protein O7G88_03105 [bacterium]|nr:hypothetical protein [bacterium]
MNLRQNGRKRLDPIHVINIRLANSNTALARYGTILNTSTSGLLIEVCRSDMSPEVLQNKLPLSRIEGESVLMTIDEMSLEIDGRVVRFCYNDQEMLEMAIDFTANAPVHWRECFADLLPSLGEFEPASVSLSSC